MIQFKITGSSGQSSGSLTMNASMIQLSQGMGRPSVWWTLDRKRYKDQAAPWWKRITG